MPDKSVVERTLEQYREGGRPARTVFDHTPDTMTKFGHLQETLWKWHDKRRHEDGFAVCSSCAVVQLFLRENKSILDAAVARL